MAFKRIVRMPMERTPVAEPRVLLSDMSAPIIPREQGPMLRLNRAQRRSGKRGKR